MRISDLLAREPFGSILAETLSIYWSHVLDKNIFVSWGGQDIDAQLWSGNNYLNFFCTPDVSQSCFTNIVREYSYTKPFWRRCLQTLYVRAGVTPPLREWIAQSHFSVSHPIPNSKNQLIIGGRNRFRILNPYDSESIVLAKAGFSRLGFERELSIRNSYARELAPRMLGTRANGLAFAEEYVVGTPANRLPDYLALSVRQEASFRLIEALHRPTLNPIFFTDYISSLVDSLYCLSSQAGLYAETIVDFVSYSCASVNVGIVTTHGDFQNANILQTNSDICIIDWETAAVRSQLYDLVTLSSSIRLSQNRFKTWVATAEH